MEIGSFKIYSVGAFLALGAIVAGIFYYYTAKKRGMKTNHIFDTVLYVMLLSLFLGRFGYLIVYHDQFQGIKDILSYWRGGLLALPGMIASFLLIIYILKRHQEPIFRSLDIIGLGFILAWSVGKVGCHLSTCTVGRPWTGFLSLDGVYPVDLLSSFLMVFLFIALYIIYLTSRIREGVIFFLTIEGFFLGEMLLKILRADFGTPLSRYESIAYLSLVTGIYLTFWLIFGPGFKYKKDQEESIPIKPEEKIR